MYGETSNAGILRQDHCLNMKIIKKPRKNEGDVFIDATVKLPNPTDTCAHQSP